GLIKVLLSMQHKAFPKLLNFKDLNPLIELAGSPFFVTTEKSEWTPAEGAPRMAAINSFGHSGTNVHLVVQEHVPSSQKPRRPGHRDVLIPLSAKTQEQLRQKSAALLHYIRSAATAIDLTSMAYTLQTGRDSMEERLALVVSSTEQLATKLHAYLEGEKSIDGVYQGKAGRNGETLSLTGGESPGSVAKQWTEGRKVPWTSLWQDAALPERMHLPGYPFAKERYWIDSAPSADSELHVPVRPRDDESIEDILNRIADESLEAHEGVQRLRKIV
ncbi:MAG TPA: ketoacyl-synthetase C-terminal extension domain-containing protein, partial [Nitrospiraceae bacterium]|nr:ketoacyl-synthetase C-terminal extension domain-containing protein [Nitrospiraceae bacterium]